MIFCRCLKAWLFRKSFPDIIIWPTLTLLTFLFYFANLEVALLLRYSDDDDDDDDVDDYDDMIVPRTRTVHYGPRSFRTAAPQIWSMLLPHLKNINVSCELFKSGLKTWLFVQAYKRRLWVLCLSDTLQILELIWFDLTWSAKGKESWKMSQDPWMNPDCHQNPIISSLGTPIYAKHFVKIQSQRFQRFCTQKMINTHRHTCPAVHNQPVVVIVVSRDVASVLTPQSRDRLDAQQCLGSVSPRLNFQMP